MIKFIRYFLLGVLMWENVSAQNLPTDYVNPFIGTSNYGTTNPGAQVPHGLMNVSPFNVMGSTLNAFDKDARWWSTPYEHSNRYFTGFSHVNLSGVGCPDMGSLLLMPTSGKLEVDYHEYGSTYAQEEAHPGYYSNVLKKYGIKTEVSATTRVGVSRFTFPKGQANILLNLGEGLTNETGATVRYVSDTELEGSKLLGSFCYTNNQAVYPIFFVMRVNKKPAKKGYWKFQRAGEKWENDWNKDAGKYKVFTDYTDQLSGDDLGAFLSFDVQENESVEVQLAVSFVSVENARKNLEAEQQEFGFEKTRAEASSLWNKALSKIQVEGGTEDQKTVFYTALYHAMIHPNILQDVNGEYPAMENRKTLVADHNRFTVFSLWDTYRNVQPLMSLVYPDRQVGMIRSMIDIYKENGWMPKWELYSRESFTMDGDPAIPVIVDAWMKGIRDYDINTAYEAFLKSATTTDSSNRIRPDNKDYVKYGYVPLRDSFDNSVSHAIEYYVADWNLSQLATSLGKSSDAQLFSKRAKGYKHYYSPQFGTFRPILPDGTFLTPFDPLMGANFEPNHGFHEGNAWNYSFAIPFDIPGLMKLMGGKKKFVDRLQSTFDKGYFDVTNEPDMLYPHVFSEIKGEEWRTQKLVKQILEKHFTNSPGGIPGNDDTGTMSTWALMNMMGIYPFCPGRPDYTVVTPVFDKVVIQLDNKYYPHADKVTIRRQKDGAGEYIKKILVDGKPLGGFKISHQVLVHSKDILIVTGDR
ncbi:glycoside hydrolase family 92 protein [Sphingobacterium sp. N143]|uniref:GH92 family glycosyl hydrolase n=1 Tax=Sphingobacterium sp. N143 TaxID=2746727 RepID=UPI00257801C3|nr:GH92 family glycosyl hydrolase [Sphingobacterium sp. N143]MDM1294225.1 glycoside hydrolase family 92 protein [Sphingobacterium sp. N143]